MSEIKQTWSADAFDAISIAAFDGQFEIQGTDGDQVELAGEFEKRFGRDLKLEPTARWLQLHLWESMWGHAGEAQFTLRLPKKKAWVVELYAGRGQVEVSGVQARLRVMLGKGEIEIHDCRGVFNLASGKGEVEMERCTEAEMPARPPMPEPGAPEFQAPPMPHGPGATGEFHFHFGQGPRMRHHMKMDGPWNWCGFDTGDWEEWGLQFGEQARAWAEQFASQFVGRSDWLPEKAGVSIQMGKGEAELEEIDAKSCTVRLGNGDAKIEDGRVETLNVTLSHGSLECKSVLPVSEWDIQVHRGDIHLELPSNTQARLDVATRHGDIDSEVPLVRVGRPGPEARHGGRMVGTIGPAEGNLAQVSLTAMSGDVEIKLQKSASKYSGRPASEYATASQPVAETAPASAQASDAARAVAEDKPAATTPKYDSQMAILQALSEGKISVAEAEELLKSLER